MGLPLNTRAGLDFDLEVKGVNHITEERVNDLVQLLQETNHSLVETVATEGIWLSRRAGKGQLVCDEANGSEIAQRFLSLDETDQEAFWANVQVESDRENWWAGGPGDEEYAGNRNPPRKPVAMRPIHDFSRGNLSLEEALRKLGRVRVKGTEWRALCPAHENHHRLSLVISESKYKPGEPVFFCYAGCTHEAVKAKVEELRG